MITLVMRAIVFFKTRAGKSPVEDYLDTLSEKEVQKVLWVLLKVIRPLSGKIYNFLVTRGKISTSSIDASFMLENRVGYIRLSQSSTRARALFPPCWSSAAFSR